jgi:hypothetical protein
VKWWEELKAKAKKNKYVRNLTFAHLSDSEQLSRHFLMAFGAAGAFSLLFVILFTLFFGDGASPYANIDPGEP